MGKSNDWENKERESFITAESKIAQRIHENQQNLSLLTVAAHQIIHNDKPKELLDSLFREISQELGLDVYFNYMYDSVQDKLKLMNYAGIDDDLAHKIRFLEMGEAVCGCVALKQECLVMEHIQQSDDSHVQLVKSIGIKAYACYPLLSYGKLIGTLSFGSSRKPSFDRLVLKLMATICEQVAVALERAYFMSELMLKNKALNAQNQQLAASEEKFRAMFDAALDGMVLLTEEGIVLDANPSACELLGIGPDIPNQEIGRLVEILHLESSEREAVLRLRDGSERIFEYAVTQDNVLLGNKLVSFRDITEKKKVFQTLLEAKELAEETSKAKTEFLTILSHELRTPLNSILGFAQISLEDKVHDLHQIQQERIHKILKSGRHLTYLVNEMLDHVSTKSGKLEMKSETLHLSLIVEESLRILQPMIEAKSICVRVCDPDRVPHVRGDGNRVKQVIINLLTNAVKFNVPHGEIRINFEIVGPTLKTMISDTGIGISQEQHKKIFDPFYRIHHPEYNVEGTGIGLTLVKSFISIMAGTVGVSSTLGEGSCFWFTLPLD